MGKSSRHQPAPPPAPSLGLGLALALALIALTFAVFWPALRCDFINYDDPEYFSANPRVLAGLTWPGFTWAFRTGHLSNWNPLTWLSFMLDVSLFGPGPAGPHFTNVLLHSLNAALVFLLARRLTGAPWPSAILAALFAWHPLRVESVAWISERKDVLSASFGLLALIFYARYAQSRIVNRKSKIVNYSAALLCFTLGLMAKPMLVTLPFVMLLLDYWPLARIPSAFRLPRSVLLEKLPFLALSAASSAVTYAIHHATAALATTATSPWSDRIANAFVSALRYLGKTFWPAHLALPYPLPPALPLPVVLLAALTILALTAAALALARRHAPVCIGWLWFLGMLLPVIGLVQWGIQAMADRFTYLPSIGLALALVGAAAARAARRPRFKNLLLAAATLALLACALRTRAQLAHWRNSETLFRHTLATTGDNALAHNNLGIFLSEHGRTADAIHHWRQALRINPRAAKTLVNLGATLAAQGRYDDALPLLETALQLKPDVAAHINLGNVLAQTGRLDDAITHFHEALRLQPADLDARFNLAGVLAARGDPRAAADQYRAILKLNPNDLQARELLRRLHPAAP